MQDPQKFRDDFLKRLDNKLHLEELFNYIPDAYFFAKDAQGRFINISRAWMDVRAIPREEDIIGKTDFDIHPQDLAEQYVAEDQRVMESATPLPNQVWLIPDRQGNLKWYLCSKIPLFGDGGKVIGVAGVLRDIKVAGSEFQSYQELDQVIAYVLEHYQERIQISELAELQSALLERAQSWLKPGGVLVYSTCSLETAEGEQQAAKVSLRSDPIHVENLPAGLQPDENGWLRTHPGMLAEKGGMDGFFIACWRAD